MPARKETMIVPRPGGLEAVYLDDGTREVRKAREAKPNRKPAKAPDKEPEGDA